MVPARDGVKLGTNVFLPAKDGAIAKGSFPRLSRGLRTNKDGVAGSLVEYYVSRGYAVVIQDVSRALPFRGALVWQPRRWRGWERPAEVDW